MPQIGWFEILIIVVLAILIVGPKDFPVMLKKIGSWIGTFKNYFTEFQKEAYGSNLGFVYGSGEKLKGLGRRRTAEKYLFREGMFKYTGF